MGSLASLAVLCWRSCRSSGLAPARHYQAGSVACGAGCATVRGARLVAFHRTHSTAPCPPRPNKGRAPKLATAARTAWLAVCTAQGLPPPPPIVEASYTNGTAYPLPTHEVLSYASTHTQTQAPRAKGLTPRAKALTPQPRYRRNSRRRYEYTSDGAGARSSPLSRSTRSCRAA